MLILDHIKTSKDNLKNTKHELSSLINKDTYSTLLSFLKSRATSFHNNINARHAKKLANLNSIGSQKADIGKNNWVVNLSKKPLLPQEQSSLPIHHLPDDSKDAVRKSSAAVFHSTQLPAHI